MFDSNHSAQLSVKEGRIITFDDDFNKKMEITYRL